MCQASTPTLGVSRLSVTGKFSMRSASMRSGTTGLRPIWPAGMSGSNRNRIRISKTGAAAAQAWDEHKVG